MTNFKKYPEVIINNSILENPNIKVINLGDDYLELNFLHPNLGQVVELFKKVNSNHYSLKMVYPEDLQEDDEIEIAKEYYNLHLLEGWETYLEYFTPNEGWYLMSRNYESEE